MVRPADMTETLLRRPFSVFEVVRDARGTPMAITILNKRAGRTTNRLYEAEPGDHIACLGPLGRPFTSVAAPTEAWMVAGGVGLAPFATLAEALAAAGTPSTLFYGARSDRELFYIDFFERLGVTWNVEGDDLVVPANQSMEIVPDLDGAIPEVKTNVWPAFPTDLISIAITVATQANGSVMFHDWMFSGRMYFTDKLVGMGAKIILCDPFRCLVQGPNQLYGENLESPDIRAGMSLLLAALTAKGKSTVRNISQIERGYEDVDKKLRDLGASIQRVSE
jgi:hypothetical protein